MASSSRANPAFAHAFTPSRTLVTHQPPPSSSSRPTRTRHLTPRASTAIRPLHGPPPRFNTYTPADVRSVRVRHILLDTRALADSALVVINSGDASLASLAAELSTCAASRGLGGDLGWWDAAEDVPSNVEEFGMVPELLGAALRTRPNAISVAESPVGFHVFVVEDVRHKLEVVRVEARRGPPAAKRKSSFPETVEGSYHIVSLGCQMNASDKERMAAVLEAEGLTWIEDEYASSLLILNTCSIRQHAEEKVYSAMGRHAARKVASQGKVTLAVAGCVAQQEGEKLLRRVPEVDIVFGPQYVGHLADLLEDVRVNQCQVAATKPVHIHEDLTKPVRESATTAWVNIIHGCNENCTYCVVPGTRGLEQSRTMENIREELVQIAKSGRREVCLLGQNVDAYGRDLQPRRTLANLLEFVHDVEGIERIRFTTGHPRYISSRLIEACATLPKVCESFHIPPQSGDDAVLKSMGRGYTAARYRTICSSIRARMPDAAISGDIIVGAPGFEAPGETEEQFQRSVQLVKDCQLDQLNTAAYSPRPNTPAAEWENQISEPVKADRLARLNDVAREVALERSQRYLGRTEEILVEAANPKNSKEVMGRTRTQRKCRLDGNISELQNKLVQVRIVDVTPYSLVGHRLTDVDPY